MTTQTKLQVGDPVLYVRHHGDRPIETTISKVTPKGSIRVNASQDLFKQTPYLSRDHFESTSRDGKVFLYSVERLTELNARAAEKEAAFAEQKDQLDKKRD